MNLMSEPELKEILAVIDGLRKEQWKQIIQALPDEGLAHLRNALADSFQGVADRVRGQSQAKRAASGS